MNNIINMPGFRDDVIGGFTAESIKRKYNSDLSLRRLQEIAKQLKDSHVETPSKKFEFPVSKQPIVEDRILKLTGNFGLISDLHIPFHDNKVLEWFCDECYKQGITRFVVIGDTLDGNHFSASRGGTQDHDRRFQDDLILTKQIYTELLKCFDKGWVLQGNHDGWFVKHMRGQLDASFLFGHIFSEFGDKIVHSDYEQARVHSGGKDFLLTHGNNYSGANPLSVAQKLSAKYEMGVCMGHQHSHCEGWSYSGKHQCVCLGGALDSRRMGYLHHSPSVNSHQTNGFGILTDGVIKTYSKGSAS